MCAQKRSMLISFGRCLRSMQQLRAIIMGAQLRRCLERKPSIDERTALGCRAILSLEAREALKRWALRDVGVRMQAALSVFRQTTWMLLLLCTWHVWSSRSAARPHTRTHSAVQCSSMPLTSAVSVSTQLSRDGAAPLRTRARSVVSAVVCRSLSAPDLCTLLYCTLSSPWLP